MLEEVSLTKVKKGHPKGLYLLFFTEMWERFSYYGMRGILIYYLTKSIIEGGLGISESSGSLIYGTFTGFVYFTPLIGGWLADKYLGQRKSITIGGVLMMLGQFVLFLINTQLGLFLGLFLLIIGNGFFKPNISTLLGSLYKEGDPRRDAGFSIFYMGINIGALFSPLVVGLLSDNIFAIKDGSGEIISHGYRYGFLAASIGMLVGQLLYTFLSKKYLGDLGVLPSARSSMSDINNSKSLNVNNKLTPVEKKKVIAILIYFFFAIFFFAGFEQAGSSISLYTDKYINRDIVIPFIGDFLIPPSWFQSVNPVFIVLLAPIFTMLWPSKVGQKITTPMKMGSGLILLGIGFFFMLGAINQRGGDDVTDIAVKASLWWVVFTYLLHTIGELCLSPVGLSTVTKLAPHKLASLLMGVWLLSSCFANWLGGGIAAIIGSYGAGTIFIVLALFPIICGVVLICMNKMLLKMMGGVR